MNQNKENLFHLIYQKKFPFILIKKGDLFCIIFQSYIIGFLAFIMETIVDVYTHHSIIDQGFLIGPFIPMYGITLFCFLFLFKYRSITWKSIIFCFFIIFFGVTIVELLVGYLMENTIQFVLWNYDGMLPQSKKYISLVASLFWGVTGTLYYFYAIPLFYHLGIKMKINKRPFLIVSIGIIILIDFFLSICLCIYHHGYRKLYEIPFYIHS